MPARAPPPAADPRPWLREGSQPSVQWRTLVELDGRSVDDPEVVAARSAVAQRGWAAEILATQRADGTWVEHERVYTPKYQSTNWKLLVLADLGVTKEHPGVARGVDRWLEALRCDDGGFSPSGGRRGHLCTTGNAARALLEFGYGDHPAVRGAFDWLVANQAKLGGWSCFGSGRNLDSWEGLSAFAALPRARWTTEYETTVARAAEFFLSRELHRQGEPYAPWTRFHYPAHYYYDLLVGLDLLTSLGFGADPRLEFALERLHAARRPDGRWNLDAVHPDVEGPVAAWFEQHPKDRPVPLALETVGAPSRLITLRALRVLRRVETARSGGPPAPRSG